MDGVIQSAHRVFPPPHPGAGAVIFEDVHLLAVNKPAGIPTHTPEPGLCWGWYEYFHWRNPGSTKLRLLHRLDRETSGVLLLAKSGEASRELASQWEAGSVFKRYLFAARRKPQKTTWKVEQMIGGQRAVTEFRALDRHGEFYRIEAYPKTGRTHQVRLHAAASGVPVVGDREHGEPRDDWPLLLHAAEIGCRPPGAKADARFSAPLPETLSAVSATEAWWMRAGLLREAMAGDAEAVRWIHGAADGFPEQTVDRYAEVWVLSNFSEIRDDFLRRKLTGRKMIVKRYQGQGRVKNVGNAAAVTVTENGLRYEIQFGEATTTGLFLDQRENRLWLKRLLPVLPPGSVLNCFAHTCSFSVVAARAGRMTASIDLSPKYLEWGKRNFVLNGVDPEAHRWLRGEAGDWIKRLKKKGERFAAVILDPPSFSRSKRGVFQVERDLEPLVREAASLVAPGGGMFIATNYQKWSQKALVSTVRRAFQGRKIVLKSVPLPPDFPYQAGAPLWMKSVWAAFQG